MYNSQDLDEVRKTIDDLDDNIHDLLMERANLIDKVSIAKKKNNIQIVQPAREAKMIRRLIARHKGPLPEEAIVRIWRELVGAVSMLQTGLSFAVLSSEKNPEYADIAKNYFGSVLPMTRTKSLSGAISLLKEGKVDFAVFPYPQMQEVDHWWSFLLEEEAKNMKIMVKLPYKKKNKDLLSPVLIVGRDMEFLSSNDDNSFIGIELPEDSSRSGVMNKLKDSGLEILSIYATEGDYSNKRRFLIEVKGFIKENDDTFNKVIEKFKADSTIIKIIGGYPVIPVFGS